MLPAFIQSNLRKRETVQCINSRKQLVTLLLPIRSSNLPFLNSKSYVGASLRFNGAQLGLLSTSYDLHTPHVIGFINTTEHRDADAHPLYISAHSFFS